MIAQTEKLAAVRNLIAAELPAHAAEAHDDMPIAPRWEVYEALEKDGRLLIVTLREGLAFAGYCSILIMAPLHHGKSIEAMIDVFWVNPQFRGRQGGRRLFRKAEEELRKIGVERWLGLSRLACDSAALFRACGFRPIETLYERRL